MKHAGGAPPKLRTPKQRARFLKMLVENLGRRKAACRRFGISTVTLTNEEKRDPEFAQQVDETREVAIDLMVAEGYKLARSGDGPMIRFFLPRLKPEEFSETQRVQHLGEVDMTIRVVEDENWYDNNAHDHSAESLAASDERAAEPGENQDRGLRPEVGKDGDGSDGLHQGPRT